MRKEAFGLDPAEDHPDLVDRLRGRLVRRWSVAEALLGRSDGPWLAGGQGPSYADLAAMPLAVRLPAWKPELAPDPERHPAVTEWFARLGERPRRRGRPPRGAGRR